MMEKLLKGSGGGGSKTDMSEVYFGLLINILSLPIYS